MKKDDSVYLEHMLIYLLKLEKYVSDKNREMYIKDEVIQNNVIRLLEVIGEASIKISKELKNNQEEVPWSKLRGMRNILVHDYGSVSLEVIWKTVTDSLPPLKAQIIQIIKNVSPQILINYDYL